MNKKFDICRLRSQNRHVNPIGDLVMALLAKDDADTLLGVHKFGLRKAVLDAWADYRNGSNYSDGVRAIHDSTTRANCVHAHIKTRVSEYAAKHPAALQVRIPDKLFTLLVTDRTGRVAGIKFKKADNELRTANVSTGRNAAWKRQEEIPEIGAEHHLEFVYRLDETEQRVLGVFLLCPNGEYSNFWADEVLETTAIPIVSDFFQKPAAEDESSNVRPRPQADVVPLKRDKNDDPDKK